jgi:hypothetical protein
MTRRKFIGIVGGAITLWPLLCRPSAFLAATCLESSFGMSFRSTTSRCARKQAAYFTLQVPDETRVWQ